MNNFVGGEVKLRVSPLSVDNSAKPSVTTHLPSGNQAKRASTQFAVARISATMRSGPPIEGMTMKTGIALSTVGKSRWSGHLAKRPG